MAILLSAPYSQFFDDDGYPLTRGFVYTYAAGTDTPQATYTDYTGTIPAANPIELDAAGRATIWVIGAYKMTVEDADGVTIRTVDHIEIVDNGGNMQSSVYDPANIQQQLVGTTAVQTITNKIIDLTPSGASGAGLNVSPGVDPTSPVNGDVWSTSTGLYAYANSAKLQLAPTLGPASATTSGTTATLSSTINSATKMIVLTFENVSTSGTSNPIIQLGDSGGFEITGYSGLAVLGATGVSPVNAAYAGSGYQISSALAANTLNGVLVLWRYPGVNLWQITGELFSGTTSYRTTGTKTLSDVLTSIRITTVGGTDTFDNGSIGQLYL